jgi:hypothetical protein
MVANASRLLSQSKKTKTTEVLKFWHNKYDLFRTVCFFGLTSVDQHGNGYIDVSYQEGRLSGMAKTANDIQCAATSHVFYPKILKTVHDSNTVNLLI